ncbi:hypothetical protein [Streptomyces sp. NPDC020983]|uniref:hypothetical protein n=1 Tax=Streptomyces sp. NPDC020983 TaxID=3365106 RepID=UPI0037AE7ACC
MGDFSGIDPVALNKMIASFDGDRTHLRERVSYWKGQFDQWGMDTQPLGELLGICGWLDDESPKLKRRENLAGVMDAGAGPGTHMVQIPEPVAETSAQAQADGKKLALEFNANDGGNSKAGDQYHALAQELLAHQDDPDFCSAFYANLTPAEATTLPTLLASTGSSTAGTDLVVFSHALATATNATYPAPGFDKVVSYYTSPLPKGPNTAAWDRAAMLQYGTFPTDFLVRTTRASGLDRFGKNADQDFRGNAFDAQALGLPQDIVTLELRALSTDEAATQQVFAAMGQDPGKSNLNGNLTSLAAYAKAQHNPELTAAFQATLNAGAGNRSTQGPYGSYYAPVLHTGAETTFATAAMSALTGAHAKQSDYQDFITTTFTTFGAPAGATPQQAGNQAASLLRLAENADPAWPATRPAIASVADQAEAGRNDTGFMQGYYGNGGADLEAKVALELHAMDGTHGNTVLSPESTRILGEFGDNLAAATVLGAKGDLPQFDARTFTAPQDEWAATMLLKYGPPGDRWDHTFLTTMADATLHWGADHQVMPTFQPAQPNGVWSDWMADPQNAWYSELGLKNDYPKHTFDQEMGITQAIADNDPRLAVLSKVAGNQTAARDLLADPTDGPFVAKQLVSEQWQLPLGHGDNSAFPAKVILLATQRGTGDKTADTAATQAAANVFQAAANDYKPGRNMFKDGTQALPPTLGVALADVAGAYVPDFTSSQTHIGASGFSVDHDANGRPQINADPAALSLLMHDFMSDNTEAAGAFRAAVHANIAVESARHKDDGSSKDASTVLTNLGRLDGSIDNVMNDLKYQPAAKADAQAQTDAMLTWIVGGVASPLIPTEGLPTLVAMANGGGTAWLSYQFSGTHAAAVVDAAQKTDFNEEQSLQLPAVNGLIHAGTIKPPPYPWYHDGNFDMAKMNAREYNAWFDQLPPSQQSTANQLSDYAKTGHSQTTAQHAGNSNNVNPGN